MGRTCNEKYPGSFVTDESGTTVIEYGLIAVLISIGIIGALTVMGATLGGFYVAIENALAGAV